MADTTAQVIGSVRRPAGAYQQGQFQANELNEQFVVQGLPIGTEMTRKGRAWGTMTVTAAAGIVVRPSTLAALELWNGSPTTNAGLSLIIDRLFFFNLVSTAVVEGFSGWAQVATTKAAPSSAGLAIRGNSGKQGYTGLAVNAIGTTVLDNGWFPWGNAYNKAAGGVVPFGAISAEVNGRLIVPPGCSLCLHVVSSLVGETFTMGAMWYEELLSIE
jgi:hypothetical protein